MQPLNVLLVEDDDDDADLVAFALGQAVGRHYELRRASSLASAKSLLAHARPDIILLDLHLPDSRGIETVSRAVSDADGVPILILTGCADSAVGLQAIELGVQDFIPKEEMLTPLLTRSIDFTIQRAQMATAAALRALTDPLTGLGNRAALHKRLETTIGHCQRYAGGFALAFIDLDGFKAINDTFGHAAGDQILVNVSTRCQKVGRASDFLCRLGGDEFVILLDGIANFADAHAAMARYAEVIEQPINIGADPEKRVSVGASAGLSVYPNDGNSVDSLMAVADSRMYAAKSARKSERRTGT